MITLLLSTAIVALMSGDVDTTAPVLPVIILAEKTAPDHDNTDRDADREDRNSDAAARHDAQDAERDDRNAERDARHDD